MEYLELTASAINPELFAHFHRRQVVTHCWRKIDGVWCVRPHAFIDDWTQKDYQKLVDCLQNTVRTGGMVTGAFDKGKLKGFVSVESEFFGSKRQYLDLSSLHVSQEMRGRGIGSVLFTKAKAWAKEKGAQKLYISAHSAVETQAFYRAMGCREAKEYYAPHVQKEPFDCQLECAV